MNRVNHGLKVHSVNPRLHGSSVSNRSELLLAAFYHQPRVWSSLVISKDEASLKSALDDIISSEPKCEVMMHFGSMGLILFQESLDVNANKELKSIHSVKDTDDSGVVTFIDEVKTLLHVTQRLIFWISSQPRINIDYSNYFPDCKEEHMFRWMQGRKLSLQQETSLPDRPFIHVDVCNRSFILQSACNLIGSDLWWLALLPLTMIKMEYVAVRSDDWQDNVIQCVRVLAGARAHVWTVMTVRAKCVYVP